MMNVTSRRSFIRGVVFTACSPILLSLPSGGLGTHNSGYTEAKNGIQREFDPSKYNGEIIWMIGGVVVSEDEINQRLRNLSVN